MFAPTHLTRLALTITMIAGVAHAQEPTRTAKDGAEMVLVPAGEFTMGTDRGNADYGPAHRLNLPAFYIDKTEVTNAQYARYMAETGAPAPKNWNGPTIPEGRENRPVTDITWFDAMKYARWAGKRLPTEAEWEKAARGTDARTFPWGEMDDPGRRNLGGGKLRPVGQFPTGASPYGALDMTGNAWEWTADWYNAYPGSAFRSVHFGEKFKVIRGGGGEYFYSHNDNSGRCAVRARILPYGSDDWLGFRCVQDVDPSKPAYDVDALIRNAEKLLSGELHQPVALSYEAEYDRYLKARQVPLTVVGRSAGHVKAGVPLPKGLIKDLGQLSLRDEKGTALPLQTRTLTPWPDGSARWVLLDFAGEPGKEYKLVLGSTPVPSRPSSMQVQQVDGGYIVRAAGQEYRITRASPLDWFRNGQRVAGPARLDLKTDTAALKALPAEQVELVENGSQRVTVRLRGAFGNAAGAATPLRYDVRVHVLANEPRVHMQYTLTNMAPRTGKTEDRTPMTLITDLSVVLPAAQIGPEVVLGTDVSQQTVTLNRSVSLVQPDAVQYTIEVDGQQAGKGTRAPGWMSVKVPAGRLQAGVRHFWQNFSKGLSVTPQEIALRLWAGPEPLEFEGTLAKSHEIVLALAPAEGEARSLDLQPLRLSVPPAWACGTEAIGGPVLPRSPESISRLPYWETMREAAMRRWIKAMRYGFRDFGDVRHGGETKGKNAANNLEYDVHFNFGLQYLRTGQTWYIDYIEMQARHQADIDNDHVTGAPYKHSPWHTTWYADIAHVFLRGLVMHYWLTGEDRSLEIARRIGDHLADRANRFDGFGNERQIGWGNVGLTGIYEATLDRKYIDAAAKLCDKLVTEQSPSGRFKIRWDNRMSLMNGMAMHGMVTVQEHTGDEKLAEGILRLARRTLGLYPEYAMRTLNGFAWCVKRTNNPVFLNVMERTVEASMEFHMPDRPGGATTSETHAWRFPWFCAKYQLFPMFQGQVPPLPSADTWKGTRIFNKNLEFLVRPTGTRPGVVLLMLEGLASGRVELFDEAGKVLQARELTAKDKQFQPASLTINPGAGRYCRVRLTSPDAQAWHVQHDAATQVTMYDPGAKNLDNLYPRAYGYLKPGTQEIYIRYEAVGEGFHTVTLYDPQGNVAATAEQFVDLDDKGRYEVELKFKVPPDAGQGWALEVFESRILDIKGFEPFWADSPDELFSPEIHAGGASAGTVSSR